MGKKLYLDCIEIEDNWDEIIGERLEGKTDSGTEINFSVYDLCECPEDATIERDLFSAADYIDALKLGMKLAREGYTDIVVDEVKEKE